MTKKEAIIKYIKEMNTDMLSLILDDDRSYMDTSKEIFLEKLDKVFSDCKFREVEEFSEVCKGRCAGDCSNKDTKGYRFLNEKVGGLDLLFEEENDDIIDICYCSRFEVEDTAKTNYSLYMKVYDDEKVDFFPTFEQINLTNKIALLQTKYNAFKNQVIPITEV